VLTTTKNPTTWGNKACLPPSERKSFGEEMSEKIQFKKERNDGKRHPRGRVLFGLKLSLLLRGGGKKEKKRTPRPARKISVGRESFWQIGEGCGRSQIERLGWKI